MDICRGLPVVPGGLRAVKEVLSWIFATCTMPPKNLKCNLRYLLWDILILLMEYRKGPLPPAEGKRQPVGSLLQLTKLSEIRISAQHQ